MVNPETRFGMRPHDAKREVDRRAGLESPQLNIFTEDHVQTLSILAANLAVSLEMRGFTTMARDEAPAGRDCSGERIQARCCGLCRRNTTV